MFIHITSEAFPDPSPDDTPRIIIVHIMQGLHIRLINVSMWRKRDIIFLLGSYEVFFSYIYIYPNGS